MTNGGSVARTLRPDKKRIKLPLKKALRVRGIHEGERRGRGDSPRKNEKNGERHANGNRLRGPRRRKLEEKLTGEG